MWRLKNAQPHSLLATDHTLQPHWLWLPKDPLARRSRRGHTPVSPEVAETSFRASAGLCRAAAGPQTCPLRGEGRWGRHRGHRPGRGAAVTWSLVSAAEARWGPPELGRAADPEQRPLFPGWGQEGLTCRGGRVWV